MIDDPTWTFDRFHFSANKLLKNMKILKVEDIFRLELAKFMHPADSQNLPDNFESCFTRIESMRNYNLR